MLALDGLDIYAGDRHLHEHAVHDPVYADGKKYAVGHLYSRNLRKGLVSHLCVSDQANRKKEHDMRAPATAKSMQGHFLFLTLDLLHLLEHDLEQTKGIHNAPEKQRRAKRLAAAQAAAAKAGLGFPKTVEMVQLYSVAFPDPFFLAHPPFPP